MSIFSLDSDFKVSESIKLFSLLNQSLVVMSGMLGTFERSYLQQYKRVFDLMVDAFSCVLLSIPLLWFEVFKMIFVVRKSVRGQLALVTGAGGGLGRSISLKLAKLGCNVAVADINIAAVESVVEELKLLGVNARGYKVDITKIDEIKKLRREVTNDMGMVTLLVNNAGLIPDMKTDVQPGFIDAMVKVNVLGTILMTRCFLDQMKHNPNGGHIVAISSMSGLHSSPFAVPYSATKAAINSYMAGLTERLRLEKMEKIQLTCICPYYVTTRKDIVDFLNPDIRFPPLDVDEATEEVVDSILRFKNFVTIPWYFDYGVRFANLFPLSIQQLIRDKILKEFEFKNQKHAAGVTTNVI